MVTTNNTKIIK